MHNLYTYTLRTFLITGNTLRNLLFIYAKPGQSNINSLVWDFSDLLKINQMTGGDIGTLYEIIWGICKENKVYMGINVTGGSVKCSNDDEFDLDNMIDTVNKL